jgi:ribosome-associated protein
MDILNPRPRKKEEMPEQFKDTQKLLDAILQALWSKNAFNTVVLHVGKLTDITDYFVIVSGRSDRHVMAISDILQAQLKDKGIVPLGVEGKRASRWVLVDYGDVVVHIFEKETRAFYELEKLWGDAQRIDVEEPQWVKDFARMESDEF